MFLKIWYYQISKKSKYLRILAMFLKANSEGVYILQSPAYIFRGIQSGCFWRQLFTV